MIELDDELETHQLTSTTIAEATRYLRQAVTAGEHWYIALLGAIGLWTEAEEIRHGRSYCYLIDGEAFDWLLLAERLCEEVDGLVPDEEKTAFLFRGKSPLPLSPGRFKELIGSIKYHQYLNFFYGITVEEALILAVEDEVRKERWTSGYSNEHDTVNEVFKRIYGAPKTTLLERFRKERSYPQTRSIGLAELKEFTYWLFKYRLKQCDKAKVASDTKKALRCLREQWSTFALPPWVLSP